MATIARNYWIASGHDNPGGMSRVQDLTDANGVRFLSPRGLPFRSRGERRYRTDGSVARIGYEQTQWLFAIMTLAQYAYALDNLEGAVTIHIPITSTTFANYNATLWLPDEMEMNYVWLTGSTYDNGFSGPGYQDVVWTFNKLEAI